MKILKISAHMSLLATLAFAALSGRQAVASQLCTIPQSACYPWRIAAEKRETTLLDVIPNNAVTGAIYRICLCPPAKSVDLVFRFGTDDVVIGRISVGGEGPQCRDFRFETSRRSKLVLRRAQKNAGEPLAGCYVTAPAGP